MSRWIYVDLAGSNAGPDFLSVEIKMSADDLSDAALREMVADHYAVPLAQIGPVSRRYRPPKPKPAMAASAPTQPSDPAGDETARFTTEEP